MTDATMPTTPGVDHKLDELREAQQRRLNEIAQGDPVWCHLAGQIEALTWAQTGGPENGAAQEGHVS